MISRIEFLDIDCRIDIEVATIFSTQSRFKDGRDFEILSISIQEIIYSLSH